MLNETDVVNWLRGLPDKRLVQVVATALNGRHLHPGESDYLDSRVLLAHATRERKENKSATWEVALLALPTDPESWVDDVPLAQAAEHCRHALLSWAKRPLCPLCGEETHAT